MKQLLIFDLDGVVYRGEEIMPHAPETLRTLRSRNIKLRFLTNNSTRTREFFRDKLRRLGVDVDTPEIMTSAHATRRFLEEAGLPGARLFIVGEEGLRAELSRWEILSHDEPHRATHVVVGMDRAFTYTLLRQALEALQAGAELIVTNRDPNFPEAGGRILPGGGAIVAAIETAAGFSGKLIGKPEPGTVLRLMREADTAPEGTLLIGDRPATDIVAGRRAGVETCLPLTGVTTAAMLNDLPPEERPHHVVDDLRGVLNLV